MGKRDAGAFLERFHRKLMLLPLPPKAYGSGRLAFCAKSMNSANVLTDTDGLTDRTKSFDASEATGIRSFNVSNGILSWICGLIVRNLSGASRCV